MTDQDRQFERLRDAYEELARRVVAERVLFADRVQEQVDEAQVAVAALADRDVQIARLAEDLQSVRDRVESLHDELRQAHAELEEIRSRFLFRIRARLGRS